MIADSQGEQKYSSWYPARIGQIFFRMLSHTGKGQSCQDYADGGTGKAGTFRVDHDDIQVEQEEKFPLCRC